MLNARSSEILDVSFADHPQWWGQIEREESVFHREPAVSTWSYRMKMGRETIWLQPIEFRILSFLAAEPYRAYTPERIVDAVGTERFPVTVETLGDHISSLRDKLGFFRDYIQSVPYIGYRFKA